VFAAVLDYLRGCSKASPALLVFEDLHWADSVSLALLEELIQTTDRETLGVIALMRPYRDDASWRFHETAQRSFAHRYTSIQLEPLDGDAATTLLRELVPDGLPADVESAVLERAEGNPFFVEEMVRSLLESSGETKVAAIPGNISTLLTARIDRLAAGSKLVVQLASVFGRQFEIGELVALVGDENATETALSDLQSRDLVVERSRIPEREYEFRHALIQETAYSTILLKERRSLHAQVATYLESHRFDSQEMAQHLIESQQETKAVPHLLAAAEQAARSMNLQTAIELFDQVLTWVPTDDVETAIRAHDGLGTAYSLIPDLSKASSTYQEMLEVGREKSRPSVQVTALNRLGSTTAFLSGDVVKATGFLEEAKRLAEEAGDEMGLAEYHMNACMIATHVGDMDRAAQHDAETARIGTSAGSEQVRIGGLVQRAQSLVYGGHFDEGQETFVHATRAAEGVTDPTVRVNLAATELVLLLRAGDVARAWTIARGSSEMASSIGLPGAGMMHLYAGMVASLLGNLEDALTHLAESARLGEELGQPFLIAAAAASMFHLYREVGVGGPDIDALREKAADLVAGPMGGMLASMVHAELGWAALSTGDLEAAAEQFENGVEGTSATKYLEAPALWVGLALVRLAAGDAEAASGLVAGAAEFVDERSMAFFHPLVALGHGTVTMAGGEPEKALRIFGDGAGLAAGMNIAPFEWRLQAARAGALRALGRENEAETAAEAAGSVIADMESRFADPALAAAFVASARATLSELAGASR
jgi:tetratricopeptide (TPR) repeat protein